MRLLACLALTLSLAASHAATITYSYQDLGDLGGLGRSDSLNNRGWISGPNGWFRYRPGVGVERLSRIGGRAFDMNDAGTLVGYLHRSGLERAIVRPKGQPWTDIGTLGGSVAWAQAINEAGQVVGMSQTSDNGAHAFSYTAAGGMVDLGTLGGEFSEAVAINEAGQILGWANTASNEQHVFLYDPVTGMTDITALIGQDLGAGTGKPSGYNLLHLSDNGTILGRARGRTGLQASIYSPLTGFRRLGTLGGFYSEPAAINDRGWVVGWSYLEDGVTRRPFLYVRGHGMRELNTWVPGLDITLVDVLDINDRDQILATGANGHTYVLSRTREASALDAVATPEPSTWALLAVGFAALAFRRKRIGLRKNTCV